MAEPETAAQKFFVQRQGYLDDLPLAVDETLEEWSVGATK